MGSTGESKKRARRAVNLLKKAAVGIALLDLILAISDSRSVGRFFLLMTMSSTFDTAPEHLIGEHCSNNGQGICETYSKIREKGFCVNSPAYSQNKNADRDNPSSKAYLKTSFSLQRLPEMFKELVGMMTWKSTFDPSRTDTNISFYLDDVGSQDGMYRHQFHSDHVEQELSRLQHATIKNSVVSTQNPTQFTSTSYADLHPDSALKSKEEKLPQHKISTVSVKPIDRKERDALSHQERAETAMGVTHTRENLDIDVEKHSNMETVGGSRITTSKEEVPSSKPFTTAKANANMKKRSTHVEDSKEITTTGSKRKEQEVNLKMILESPPEDSPNQVKNVDKVRSTVQSSSKGGIGGGDLRSFRGSSETNSRTTKNKSSSGENAVKSKGPKKLTGFLQQELFSRWALLMEDAQLLLKQGNKSNEQLNSEEAKRIIMHIEVKPFGPDPFKESGFKSKAVAQMLYDYPWIIVYQLWDKLPATFTKIFVVISLYTWVWGSLIASMLLFGSLMEDQTILHGWIIFNILYSLLLFMIDDWIHSNIDPFRSSASVWLFILYSVYKPLATWIVLTQWSEMKKLHSSESLEGPGHYSVQSSPSKSSDGSGTTKESTVVDISPSKSVDLRAVSTLTPPVMNTQANNFTEYEEDDTDDDDDGDDIDEEEDSNEENEVAET